MTVFAPASMLPFAKNLKSSATTFFYLCLSRERQPPSDKKKTDPGNLSESLDRVYQSSNPGIRAFVCAGGCLSGSQPVLRAIFRVYSGPFVCVFTSTISKANILSSLLPL
ncbi:hypothetical protein CSKR_200647 [Clonorchis sinensis]|uniref:Uncharacterized protein n=1 Tax=Clonorchis sinensis TaxID=79923 RepID=A0A8T1MF74_CLOSI|nr:hypothetical protein CSKR_200647 [Clonorchis sinensis]